MRLCNVSTEASMIRCLTLAILALAGPAFAQDDPFCQELWLSRNTIMDRAGQCFTTPLGEAVFDNSDCVEGETRLNPLDAELVRMAQAIEQWAVCDVDTGTERLDVAVLPFRARLMELFTVPVLSDGEFGCTGYLGEPVPLYAGISINMTVIGMLEPGQTVTMSHNPLRGGWQYLEVSAPNGGATVAHGWAQGWPGDPDEICTFSAG